MSAVIVRGYRSADEAALLQAWGQALPFDPIDQATFHRKVLLDPNFHSDWLLVAQEGESLVGFCLCLIRRAPLEKTGMQPDAGWISAFGVRPDSRRRGIGSALLEAALALFRRAGRQTVSVAPYMPNYFVPGVDVERYAEGLRFLTARGFEELDRPMSMDTQLPVRDLAEFVGRAGRLRAEQGVEVRPMRPPEVPDLMEFLQAHMPGDWVRHAREVLLDITRGIGGYEQFTLALKDGEVVGYCQFEGEHFGPFGVREGMQGQGIGTVLLATCLQTMQRRGLHAAFVLWTSDANADKVYSRFGFRETRRFAVLRRGL
ncbi:MAG: GNAT family N-acetyltransferase [Candidatus Latescibacterota bacterium]